MPSNPEVTVGSNKKSAACVLNNHFCMVGLNIFTLSINKSLQGPSSAKISSREKREAGVRKYNKTSVAFHYRSMLKQH